MHLHILGICGTFMAGLAMLARHIGYRVSGSDQNAYPPMSSQLAAAGIVVQEGYDPAHLRDPRPDLVIVGNAMTRGNRAVEYLLNSQLPYTSGPQWLAEHILTGQHVLAVAGTHGKTTTSAMLAWILEQAGLQPGFLIGGVPLDFTGSARFGAGSLFVVEADEYDSAFFDKRSKFIHYRPRTLVLNNLEYDHADIFPDLEAIQRQFHHLVRTLASKALLVSNGSDENLQQVLAMGCWTPCQTFARGDWEAHNRTADDSAFDVCLAGEPLGRVSWAFNGLHNVHNALAAIAAAYHVGVEPGAAIQSLNRFRGVKRRLELLAQIDGISIYDDFAHHPTAIATTLDGIRRQVGSARILAVLEPRSNTMRLGIFAERLEQALSQADRSFFYCPPELDWQFPSSRNNDRIEIASTVDALLEQLTQNARQGDHIVIMSNGGFGGIHQRLLSALEAR